MIPGYIKNFFFPNTIETQTHNLKNLSPAESRVSDEGQRILTECERQQISIRGSENLSQSQPNNLAYLSKKELLKQLKDDPSSRISNIPNLIREYLLPMIKQRQEVGAIATTEPLEKKEFTLRLKDREDKPFEYGENLILKNDGSFAIGSFKSETDGVILFFSQEGKLSHQVDVIRKMVDPYYTMDDEGDLIVSTLGKMVKFKDGKPFIEEDFRSFSLRGMSHAQGQTYVVDESEVLLLDEKLKVTSTIKLPKNFSFKDRVFGFGFGYMAGIVQHPSNKTTLAIYSFKEKKWLSLPANFQDLGKNAGLVGSIRSLNFDANSNLLIARNSHLSLYNLEGELLRTIVLPEGWFSQNCVIGRDGKIHILAEVDNSHSGQFIYSTL